MVIANAVFWSPVAVVGLLVRERWLHRKRLTALSGVDGRDARVKARSEIGEGLNGAVRSVRPRDVLGLYAVASLLVPICVVPLTIYWYGGAEFLLIASPIPMAAWWLSLDRAGVRAAVIPPIVAWAVAQLCWTVTMLIWSDTVNALNIDAFGYNSRVGWVGFVFPTLLVMGVALVSLISVLAGSLHALGLRVRYSLMAVVVPSVALGTVVWSSSYYGPIHLAVAIFVVGYAISRRGRKERELREYREALDMASDGVTTGRDRVGKWLFRIGVAVWLLSLALVVMLVVGAIGAEDAAGIADSLVGAVLIAACAAAVLLWARSRGNSREWGAMLIGIAWLPIPFASLGLHRGLTMDGFSTISWLATAVAVGLVLTVMWRVFGPGALPRVDRGEVAKSELTKG